LTPRFESSVLVLEQGFQKPGFLFEEIWEEESLRSLDEGIFKDLWNAAREVWNKVSGLAADIITWTPRQVARHLGLKEFSIEAVLDRMRKRADEAQAGYVRKAGRISPVAKKFIRTVFARWLRWWRAIGAHKVMNPAWRTAFAKDMKIEFLAEAWVWLGFGIVTIGLLNVASGNPFITKWGLISATITSAAAYSIKQVKNFFDKYRVEKEQVAAGEEKEKELAKKFGIEV